MDNQDIKMKQITKILALAMLVLASCIGTDLEDEVPENLSIIEPTVDFRVNGEIELNAILHWNGQVLILRSLR